MINGKYYAIALLAYVAGSSVLAFGDERVVDYDGDIRPILSARCFRCHGPERQESGLRLDVRGRALAGGEGGVSIVAGKSSESELIRRVASNEEGDRMPPKGEQLTASQVDLLRRWIDQGAEGIPESGTSSPAKRHWAFRPIQRRASPAVRNAAWPHNAIDRFVLSELEERKIAPAPEAARETLIRRLSLDLIGLPPTWSRVVEFVEDARPNAYQQLVEELLASPRYGERWGRHWLDLARHADSTGYESDQPRETWAYRDWVINALNADMPFDQFVIEQLAGDLLPVATIDQRIATGFHCNAMLDPGVRPESILDRVNTTGAVFLGLTTGCAQCHTHKTDPLTQREFYQLYAFFNDASIGEMQLDGNFYVPPAKPVAAEPQTETEAKPSTTLVMKQSPQPTHIFIRGECANPGERVEAGFPVFLNPGGGPDSPPPTAGAQSHLPVPKQLTRLDLANWLVSRDNPLTARVTANRIWQRFFGLGIVETESDFGMQTSEPLHSELLDYLASELRGGTSPPWQGLKSLHRLIVTSATYCQASNIRPELAGVDPANRLFARQRRIRLEAEIIRDVSLEAGNILCNKLGGKSVFPYQADGVLENRATPAEWTMSEGEDRYRRGMYTWVWRLTPHPNLPLFDAPDGVTACTRRDRSNVPVQALTLLNDPTFVEAARALAVRIVSSPAKSDDERITRLTQTCLSRGPSTPELKLLQKLIAQQRHAFTESQNEAVQISGDSVQHDCHAAELAAWIVASRVLINLDEFITRE